MTKKGFGWIWVGGIIIFLAVITLFFSRQITEKQSSALISNGLPECDNLKITQYSYSLSSVQVDFCYLKNAIIKNDSNLCKRLSWSEDRKNLCAKLANGYKKCENLSSDLKSMCYSGLAMAKGDIKICDLFKSKYLKYDCYIKIATENKDIQICMQILDTDTMARCYVAVAESKKDIALCDQLPKSWVADKEDCYGSIAVVLQDLDICNKAQKSEKRNRCYSMVAESKEDTNICNLIKGDYVADEDKDQCYLNIAILKKDIGLCDNLGVLKDQCYSQIGPETLGESACMKISGLGIKDKCYLNIAILKKDIAICDKTSDSDNKDMCISSVALVSDKESICEKIEKLEIKEECYLLSAVMKNSFKICEKISKESLSLEKCYSGVAAANNDVNICEKILNSADKKERVSNVAIYNNV